jgi:hypothetical protein
MFCAIFAGEKFLKALKEKYSKKYYSSLWQKVNDTMADILFKNHPK